MSSDVNIRITGEDTSGPAFRSVAGHADELENAFGKMSGALIGQFAGIAAGLFSVQTVLKGIENADDLRDLDASMKAFSSSTGEAEKSLAFFEEAQAHTRNTGDELAKMYRDILPMSMKRFGEEGTRELTVQMAQIAPLVGKTAAEMDDALKQILSGHARGTNPLIQLLGGESAMEEFNKQGHRLTDDMLTQIAKLAKDGEALGDTFQSAGAKVKDAWLDAVSEGFNETRKGAESAGAAIRGDLTSPETLQGLRDVGSGIAGIAAAFGGLDASLSKFDTNLRTFLGIVGGPGGVADTAGDIAARTNAGARNAQFNAGAKALSSYGLDRGLRTGDDWKGGWDALQQQIGSVQSRTSEEQFKRFMSAISKSAKDGVVSLVEYRKAYADVFAETKNRGLHDAGGGGGDHGDQQKKVDAARASVRAFTADLLAEISVTQAHEAVLTALTPLQKEEAQYLEAIAKSGAAASKMWAGQAASLRLVGAASPEIRAAAGALALWRGEQEQIAQLARQQHYNDISRHLDLAASSPFDVSHHLDSWVLDDVKDRVALVKAFKDAAAASVEVFHHHLGDIFGDVARTGGKNFGEIAAQTFGDLVQTGADDLAARLIGVLAGGPGTTAQKDAQGNLHYYQTDAQGITHDVTGSSRIKAAQSVIQFGEIGFGAYSSAQNAPGTRTGSLIGGAAAGAGIGMELGSVAGPYGWAIGAIVGAIVGAIGGALGSAARQSEYKFGEFHIGSTGDEPRAYAMRTQNLGDAELKGIISRIQKQFETLNDEYIRLLMKVPNAAINAIHDIDGHIQDNPSAFFMKHLDEWVTRTLPESMLGLMEDSISPVFTSLGVSADRFHDIFMRLSASDPSTALAKLNALYDGLESIKKSSDFFSAPSPLGGGSSSYLFGMSELSAREHQLPGYSISKTDADILQFAEGLKKNLSLDGQIAAINEIARMNKDRYDMEKQLVAEIYSAVKATRDQFAAANETLDLQKLTKGDGTPDAYALAQYFKNKADRDLQLLGGASDAATINELRQKYINDIMQAEQYGLQQADPKQKNDWIEWTRQQLAAGEGAVNTQLGKLGLSMDEANEKFMAKLNPLLASFNTTVPPVTAALDDVGQAARGAVNPLKDFAVALGKATDRLNGIAGGGGGVWSPVYSGNNFAASTIAQRGAA
jgi:hypothetical protein